MINKDLFIERFKDRAFQATFVLKTKKEKEAAKNKLLGMNRVVCCAEEANIISEEESKKLFDYTEAMMKKIY